MEILFDADSLSFGQAEFLCEYTGRSLDELQQILTTGQLGGRDLVAILAISRNPDDPQAAVPEVRAAKVSDLQA